MNIYQINDIDWVMGNNEKEAEKNYKKIVSDDSFVKRIDETRLLSDAELEQNELYNEETKKSCSFKIALENAKEPKVFRLYSHKKMCSK